MFTKRQHEGWLLIDNREAPGVSLEQAAASGKEVVGAGERGVYECAIITCSHCHRTIALNPQRTRERGYCRRCDHYICDDPGCNADCLPMEKILDVCMNNAHHGRIIVPDLAAHPERRLIIP